MTGPELLDLPGADLDSLTRRISWSSDRSLSNEDLIRREWLVTNGLGGYASGTIVGAVTRRFHGLLIAALPAPHGRVMLVNHLAERLRFADRTYEWLGAHGLDGRLAQAEGTKHLVEFRLEAGIPTWRYQVRDLTIERSILMPYGQNTVHVSYRIVEGGGSVRITLRPLLDFRAHEAPLAGKASAGYEVAAREHRIEVRRDDAFPTLRLVLHTSTGRGAFTVDGQAIADVRYLMEESRGYDHEGPLSSPGYFRADLAPQHPVTLIASVEPWETIGAINPDEAVAADRVRRTRLLAASDGAARTGAAAQLVLAADQFIVRPSSRTEDEARARAGGGDARTIIAGYHWFTDWGRDTMIALEGLTLVTGRHAEAREILRTFAHHVRRGLIPNLFPEGQREGLYHTADATLWFFHALDRYEACTGDSLVVDELLPSLLECVDRHLEGTDFGIRAEADGLLTQGAEGYQLTWMDAKVDGWVVTPRRGKAVEINALWYNALVLAGRWLERTARAADASRIRSAAERARRAFNERFWNPATGCLYDVVDGESGNDDACRPNQLLAISLPNPVLDRAHWASVMDVVMRELVTPMGPRSLSPRHPDYKARYFGDLRTRDAAYHQGTVWAWLTGPLVDAWLALDPGDRAGARRLVEPMLDHLDDACVGSISEIFDAEPPFTPRGCIAQAWSVAEVLRTLVRTSAAAE
jgi:predicted glycogen debranching enzyme